MAYDHDFQSPASYGHDPNTRKNQGQKTVSSKDTVETIDRETDGHDMTDHTTFPANAVGKYRKFYTHIHTQRGQSMGDHLL